MAWKHNDLSESCGDVFLYNLEFTKLTLRHIINTTKSPEDSYTSRLALGGGECSKDLL